MNIDLVTNEHGMRIRNVYVDANLLFPEAQHDLWREHLDGDTPSRSVVFDCGGGQQGDDDDGEPLWIWEPLNNETRFVLDLAANPGTTVEDRAKTTLVTLRWGKRKVQSPNMNNPDEYGESEE